MLIWNISLSFLDDISTGTKKSKSNLSWGIAVFVHNLKHDLLALIYISRDMIYLNQTKHIDFQE